MKLALVTDQILLRAGSERVFQYFCEEFPDADTFTCAYNLDTTWHYFRERPPRATWLNWVVRNHKAFKYGFPLATHVMERLDLTGYDAVLSLSATVAKYVRAPLQRHICYCLVPTRALWNDQEYFRQGFTKAIFDLARGYLRKRDYRAAQRVDKFLCISEYSRQLIAKHYGRYAEVIHSPIEVDRFTVAMVKRDHYLLVSRLEGWKKLEYAIEGFNLSGRGLRIIGTGPEEFRLKRMARGNIEFLGEVTDSMLAEEYASAAAVIFTPELEYGLIPLEACAAGTPVICYGRGGVEETMIPLNEETAIRGNATAIFFYKQSAEDLVHALERFECSRGSFQSERLRQHAKQWSVPQFKIRIRRAVETFVNGSDSSVFS